MQPFLLQPPNVHSQQSSQRNPLWHLHHAPQWLCVSVCVCTVWVCTQLLMKRDRLCWGLFLQAMRLLWYSRWTIGVWFLFFGFFCTLEHTLFCSCGHAWVIFFNYYYHYYDVWMHASLWMSTPHHTVHERASVWNEIQVPASPSFSAGNKNIECPPDPFIERELRPQRNLGQAPLIWRLQYY